MSKHTPGPWATDEADHDAPHQDIKIKAGKHRTVCTVWIDDAPVQDFNAEQRANAQLIAAAPDLLEALRAVSAAPVTASKVEKLSAMLDELIFADPDLAERIIEKHLARIELHKRLAAITKATEEKL